MVLRNIFEFSLRTASQAISCGFGVCCKRNFQECFWSCINFVSEFMFVSGAARVGFTFIAAASIVNAGTTKNNYLSVCIVMYSEYTRYLSYTVLRGPFFVDRSKDEQFCMLLESILKYCNRVFGDLRRPRSRVPMFYFSLQEEGRERKKH